MVILIIEVNNLAFYLIHAKRYAPVPRNAQAPNSFPVAGELVGFPAWNVAQFLHVLHFLQERHNVAHFLNHSRRQTGSIIALDEAL